MAGPILFYADVIYGKRLDESLKRNGPIQCSSCYYWCKPNLQKAWFRIPCWLEMDPKDFFCHKIISGLLPVCYMYISYCGERVYQTGSPNQENLQLSTRIKIFESSFFPQCIKDWNNLSEKPRKLQFKIKMTSFIRNKENLFSRFTVSS